jgi:predicted enzyme related to lactoylglutathione lyase
MKKLLYATAFLFTFLLGYGFSMVTTAPSKPRITGIGGIFFKAKDPTKLRAWYAEHFGMQMQQFGTVFEWHQGIDSTKKGFTVWTPFKETTKYFQPSEKDFMINYRVEHLGDLLTQLKASNITPDDTIERTSYGDFVHLMDPEGNKIELWEPKGSEYAKMGISFTK